MGGRGRRQSRQSPPADWRTTGDAPASPNVTFLEIVLSADVLRVRSLTVLLIKSPGKRQGNVDATAYVVCRLNPAEGEAFRLFKLTADGA